jgi:hypothetical protein
MLTTAYVFDVVDTYPNSRGLYASAEKTGKRLLESPSVELVRVGDDLFRRASDLSFNLHCKSYRTEIPFGYRDPLSREALRYGRGVRRV